MSVIRTARILSVFLLLPFLGAAGLSACNTLTAPVSSSISSGASSSARFASGTKGVKIVTSDTTLTGSFGTPGSVPVATPAPANFPGAGNLYLPGVSAVKYFDMDGQTQIMQPSWLLDFQLGITATAAGSACATFGGAGGKDVQDFYRVSEKDCAAVANGSGGGADSVFARIVLNRDTSVLGSGENLLVQVEYQASNLHLNSDGTNLLAEDNLDQLWKIFWNTTVVATANPFAVFVPPATGGCLSSGTGLDGPGACSAAGYKGGAITVRQFIIPLSAYPTMSVVQLSRVKSRVTTVGGPAYINNFCAGNDNPLCLGVVIRSITILRM